MRYLSPLLLVFVVVGLAACGGGSGGAPAPLPGQSAVDAQATLNAYNLQLQATAAVQAQQTAAAARSTAEHESMLRATAGAATVAAATATMSAQSTADTLTIRQTEVAVQMVIDSATADASATHAWATPTASAQQTADAQMSANVALVQRDTQVKMEQEQRREETRLKWQPILYSMGVAALGSAALAGLGFLGFVLWRAVQLQRKPVITSNGVNVLQQSQGLLAAPTLLAITAGPAHYQPAAAGGANGAAASPSRAQLPPATWSHFARWSSSTRLPLGVGSNSEAILLDTQLSPHLFIAGSSRRGKTSGGLVPYVTWSLSVGYNVILLGERAADFGAFYEHPNVTNLRAFSDEERVELTQAALEAARREMERRDQVLHAAGLNTWRELLRREPEEAGQLLVAVDEFLALATMGGTVVHRSMMQNVASLTSQAGKFGIGLVLAATDPRREALGAMGYLAIKQCARMAFGFNDRGSSRSVLGDESAFNLPQGVFVYEDTAGGRHRGAAFHPSTQDVRALLAARPVAARELPETLRDVATRAADTVDVWSVADADDGAAIILPAPADPILHGMQTSRGFVSPSEVEKILEARRMGLPHYQIEEHTFGPGKKNGAFYYMVEDVLRHFELSDSTVSTER